MIESIPTFHFKSLQEYFAKNLQDYNSEPLLEYVREVTDHFWPEEEYLIRFVTRLLDNRITNYKLTAYENAATETEPFIPPSYLDSYEKDFAGLSSPKRTGRPYYGELAGTLKVYGLDTSKFWYLCLMIKDLVEGATKKGCLIQAATPRRQITELISQLEQLKPYEFSYDYMKSKNVEIELSLKIKNKKGKNSKRVLITNNRHTLLLIHEAIQSYLNTNEKESTKMDIPIINGLEDYIFLKEDERERVKLSLFYQYLIWFLDRRTVDKEYANSSIYTVSKSKNLLITRMAYFTGLTDNDSFIKKDGEYLRTYISGRENVKLNTFNAYYDVSEVFEFYMDYIEKLQMNNL